MDGNLGGSFFVRFIMRRRILTSLLALFVSGSCALAQSPALGFNFAATDPDAATSTVLPDESAGVVPQTHWNNLTGATGSATNGLSYDQNGTAAPSSATISWSSPNTWRSGANNAFFDGPDKKLTSGYLDTGNTAANGISIMVKNLDDVFTQGGYDVYVYFISDSSANRGGGYTLDDGNGPVVKYGSTMGSPFEYVEDPGTDRDLSIDGNYLHFVGLTGKSFTLTTDTTLTSPNGFRAPVNAIQIVPATPFGPDITTQPISAALYAGGTATFTAQADGFPRVTSVQWKKDGVALTDDGRISGAKTTTLVITNVSASDAGSYTLTATSSRGSEESQAARLSIIAPATAEYPAMIVAANPLANWRLNEPLAETNAFDYVGGYTGAYSPLSFWGAGTAGPSAPAFSGLESDNTAVDTGTLQGATAVTVPTPTLNTNTATFVAWIFPNGPQANYSGIFMTRSGTQAGLGYTTDNQVGYTWNNNSTWSWSSGLRPPDFEWSMVAVVIEPDKATLYLGASGSLNAAINPIAHQNEAWGGVARIGDDAGGANRVFYGMVDEVAMFDHALSFDEIAALYASATGVPQTTPPTISPQPQSATRYAGANVTLEARAAGSGLTYQWFKDGAALTNSDRITGAAGPTLELSEITAGDAGQYTLKVTNTFGETTSDPATITVLAVPQGYASAVLQYDPLAYWRLNETGDPSTGTEPAIDYWKGHDGTYGAAAQNGFNGIAGPTPADGLSIFEADNGALRPTPNLADSWATVSGPGVTTDTLTLLAWIHPDNVVTNAGIVFARAGQPATGLDLGGAGHLGYHWLDTSATYSWDSQIAPPLGQWSLAALVVQTNQAVVYLVTDTGVQSATNTFAHAPRAFTDNIRIGGDPNSVNRTFDGRIDEVALFDFAMTRAQIAGLYHGEVAATPAALSIARSGNQITISWDQPGTLQSTTALQGASTAWTDEATTGNSLTVTPEGAAKFYRVAR